MKLFKLIILVIFSFSCNSNSSVTNNSNRPERGGPNINPDAPILDNSSCNIVFDLDVLASNSINFPYSRGNFVFYAPTKISSCDSSINENDNEGTKTQGYVSLSAFQKPEPIHKFTANGNIIELKYQYPTDNNESTKKAIIEDLYGYTDRYSDTSVLIKNSLTQFNNFVRIMFSNKDMASGYISSSENNDNNIEYSLKIIIEGRRSLTPSQYADLLNAGALTLEILSLSGSENDKLISTHVFLDKNNSSLATSIADGSVSDLVNNLYLFASKQGSDIMGLALEDAAILLRSINLNKENTKKELEHIYRSINYSWELRTAIDTSSNSETRLMLGELSFLDAFNPNGPTAKINYMVKLLYKFKNSYNNTMALHKAVKFLNEDLIHIKNDQEKWIISFLEELDPGLPFSDPLEQAIQLSNHKEEFSDVKNLVLKINQVFHWLNRDNRGPKFNEEHALTKAMEYVVNLKINENRLSVVKNIFLWLKENSDGPKFTNEATLSTWIDYFVLNKINENQLKLLKSTYMWFKIVIDGPRLESSENAFSKTIDYIFIKKINEDILQLIKITFRWIKNLQDIDNVLDKVEKIVLKVDSAYDNDQFRLLQKAYQWLISSSQVSPRLEKKLALEKDILYITNGIDTDKELKLLQEKFNKYFKQYNDIHKALNQAEVETLKLTY